MQNHKRQYLPQEKLVVANDGTKFKILAPAEFEELKPVKVFRTATFYLSMYTSTSYEGKAWWDRNSGLWGRKVAELKHDGELVYLILDEDDPSWGPMVP